MMGEEGKDLDSCSTLGVGGDCCSAKVTCVTCFGACDGRVVFQVRSPYTEGEVVDSDQLSACQISN